MVTALTVYPVDIAASGLTTATRLVATVSGTTSSAFSTTLSTATGYSEIYPRGTAAAWQSLGSMPAPTGNGHLFDVTTLESQTLQLGNYTPSRRTKINGGNASITVDMYVRFYKYNPTGPTYTLIGTCSLLAQTLTSSSQNLVFSATSLSAMAFGTGDKLYVDEWYNVTSNPNTLTAAAIRADIATSTTTGETTCQFVTPGYAPTVVVLASTLAGAGTLAPTLSANTALAVTEAGAGTLAATLSAGGTLSATLAGAGTLTGTLAIIAWSASAEGDGVGALSGTLSLATALVAEFDGVGALSGALSLAMALTLYGSDVADATLTTACDMAATTGGAETSTMTTLSGSGKWAEVLSQGGTMTTLPSIGAPTGNGWIYSPGAGTFATGNWSVAFTFASSALGSGPNLYVRFYRYSAGVYTAIGSINNITQTSAAKTTYTPAAVSMSTITFATGDLIYVDVWKALSVAQSGTLTVYESTSASAGVANDMAITTSAFTSTAPVALSTQCDGVGTLVPTLSIIAWYASVEFDGVGALWSAGTLMAEFDGVGAFVAILDPALTVYPVDIAASGLTTATRLVGTGSGATGAGFSTTLSKATGYSEIFPRGTAAAWQSLGSMPAPSGNGHLFDVTTLESQTLKAGTYIPSRRTRVGGANANIVVDMYVRFYKYNATGPTYTLIGTCTNLAQTLTGTSVNLIFAGNSLPAMAFAVGDKLYVDEWYNVTSNPNTLTTATIRADIASSTTVGMTTNQFVTPGFAQSGVSLTVTLAGSGALAGTLSLSTALSSTLSGMGTLSGTATLSTVVSATLAGVGTLAATLTATAGTVALSTTLAGAGTLSGTLSLSTALAATEVGVGTLTSAQPVLSTALTSTLAGSGTLAGTLVITAVFLTGTLSGSGTLTGTATLTTALTASQTGVGTLAGTLQFATSLSSTLSGVGTLAATLAATTALSGTLAGIGTLTGAIYQSGAALSGTLAGVGTLSGATSLTTALSVTLAGVGTLTGLIQVAGQAMLVVTLSGVGTMAGTLSANTALAVTEAGTGTLAAQLGANTVLSGTLVGSGTLSGTLALKTALSTTILGIGTLAGTISVAGGAVSLTGTLAGAGQLSGTLVLSTALTGTMAAMGTLAVAVPALTTALASQMAGTGTLSGAFSLSTQLTGTASGTGALSATLTGMEAFSGQLAGTSTLAGTLALHTALGGLLAGTGTLSGAFTLSAALSLTFAAVGTLMGSLTIPVMSYLSATWITRDGLATWVTRDEQDGWTTRDEQDSWKTRG